MPGWRDWNSDELLITTSLSQADSNQTPKKESANEPLQVRFGIAALDNSAADVNR